MNDTFLKACRGEPTEYTPIWIMRQAGRYLPGYRKIREKVDFLTLCKTPELAAEVTIQPLEILKVDAAILFSDILIVLEPMGLYLEFSESKGPIIHNPIRKDSDLKRLKHIIPEIELSFVIETIKLLVQNIKVPLIGFAGAPFTVATYMIEGGTSKNFSYCKSIMYKSPAFFHDLLEFITENTSNYLLSQIQAGVQAVQIFDSWAGALSPYDYKIFALPYVQKIIKRIKNKVPVIYFAFNSSSMIEEVAKSGADVLSLDWRIEISEAIKRLHNSTALQGNLDPCILFGTDEVIRERVSFIIEGAKRAKGHIFNLGHGILPETSPDKVIKMVDMVHSYKK